MFALAVSAEGVAPARKLLPASVLHRSGNLLGDTALLSSLNETKAKALTVTAALADGRKLAAQLDQQRGVYRPLAARGSALYFSLLQLRKLDSMYCFSLAVRFLWVVGGCVRACLSRAVGVCGQAAAQLSHVSPVCLLVNPGANTVAVCCCVACVQMFLQLFKQLFSLPATQSPQHSQGQEAGSTSNSEEASTRNALLSQQLLALVHGAVSRAMFSKDHLSLALHLARHLHPQQFPDHEWAVLLSCSSAVVGASSSTRAAADTHQSRVPAAAGAPAPAWLGADRAAVFDQIAASLPELVVGARLQDSKLWAPWDLAGGGMGAIGTAVPVAVSSALTVLQQLILVAAFQPERWGSARC